MDFVYEHFDVTRTNLLEQTRIVLKDIASPNSSPTEDGAASADQNSEVLSRKVYELLHLVVESKLEAKEAIETLSGSIMLAT